MLFIFFSERQKEFHVWGPWGERTHWRIWVANFKRWAQKVRRIAQDQAVSSTGADSWASRARLGSLYFTLCTRELLKGVKQEVTSLESHCIAAESTSPVSRTQEPGLHAVGVVMVPETTGGVVEMREDGGLERQRRGKNGEIW